jgi:hypothetical protein
VSALPHNLGQTLIERITKAYVRDESALKESEWPYALSTVDNLIWDHKVTWLDFLLEGSNG